MVAMRVPEVEPVLDIVDNLLKTILASYLEKQKLLSFSLNHVL